MREYILFTGQRVRIVKPITEDMVGSDQNGSCSIVEFMVGITPDLVCTILRSTRLGEQMIYMVECGSFGSFSFIDEMIEVARPDVATVCSIDGSEYDPSELVYIGSVGGWICERYLKNDVFAELFCRCRDCGLVCRIDNCEMLNDDPLCRSCYDDYTTCDSCGVMIHYDNLCDSLCGDCYDDRTESDDDDDSSACLDYRDFDENDDLIGNDETLPKTIRSNRTYGIEIECDMNSHDRDTIASICESLPCEIGIVADGSVSGKCPVELVTCPLGGNKGERFLRDVSDTLAKRGVAVNTSCGLHVHIGASDYLRSFSKIKNLILFYASIEDIIFSLVPYSRRKNRYCKRIVSSMDIDKIRSATSITLLEQAYYEQDCDTFRRKAYKYDDKRYSFLNIHALFHTGKTIEIRNHAGTVMASKIVPWIELHTSILDYVAKSNTRTIEKITEKFAKMKDLQERTGKLFKILKISDEIVDYFDKRQAQFVPKRNEGDSIVCVFGGDYRGCDEND